MNSISENILTPELSSIAGNIPAWEPRVGDLAVNFNTGVRVLEIGYTDSFGGFNPDMILVKIIDKAGLGQKYYANRAKLFPAI